MTLVNDIKSAIKDAMKAKDKLRLEVLRGLSAAFVNELVASGQKPDAEISDELATKVLKRALKQRKEAAEQFKSGGREDLAEKEEKEAEIIKEFLPEELSDDAIKEIVQKVADSLGDDLNFAKLMPSVMKEVSGKADGSRVRKVVEEFLG